MQNQNSSIVTRIYVARKFFFIVVVEQHRTKLPAREYNRTTILKNEIEKFRKKMQKK